MNAPTASELLVTSALLRTAEWLQSEGYHFTTVTPATHARVNARPGAAQASDLRGVFGWSRPFEPGLLPAPVRDALQQAGLLHAADARLLRSAVRFSSLDQQLFAHSAHPTVEADAVFLGPDTYRFVALVQEELRRQPLPGRPTILDMGCGAGVGGIMAAHTAATLQPRLMLTDINPRALRFAAANAAHAGCGAADLLQGDLFAPVHGQLFDLVIANPPYLNDADQRAYRHGGGRWGEGLSQRIVREGLPCLGPGGRLVLYTGVAIVDGVDPLLESLRGELQARGWPWHYRELDPDVFGEELDLPAYHAVDRIAVTALVVQRQDDPTAAHLHPAMA